MFKTVAIGGTFDRLHKGHKHFILQAFKISRKVIIGLTSDSFVKAKFQISNFKFQIKSNNFSQRKRELEGFLREEKLSGRADIIEINDVYGNTLKPIDIEAIVVTGDSRAGGEEVNRKRKELKLSPLEIIDVDLVKAEDEKTISSTRIRFGEIDRWGVVFSNLSIYEKKIPEDLRQKLKKPLGKLIHGTYEFIDNRDSLLISVGDEITSYLNKLGKQADISIVDFYIKRVRVHESLSELGFPDKFKLLKANNPAGYITDETVFAVKTAVKEFIKDGIKRVIKIEGEEDLAALPSILLAPLGSIVLYGQPDQGIVAVEVTEEKKEEILRMI